MKKLALKLPGYGEIQAPDNIPSGTNATSDVLQTMLNLLAFAVVLGALIFILYGGILWVTSQGDKGKIEKARHTITYAIIGLVVMILAFVIVQTVGTLLGVSDFANFGK